MFIWVHVFTSMINRLQKLRYKISKRKIEFTRDANKVLSVFISRSERKSISVYTLYFYKPRFPPPPHLRTLIYQRVSYELRQGHPQRDTARSVSLSTPRHRFLRILSSQIFDFFKQIFVLRKIYLCLFSMLRKFSLRSWNLGFFDGFFGSNRGVFDFVRNTRRGSAFGTWFRHPVVILTFLQNDWLYNKNGIKVLYPKLSTHPKGLL